MKNWQQRAAEFSQTYHLSHPPHVYALDLMSELGEVAKEILLATNYGERPFTPSPALHSELGDALYSLCQLAASANVDLEDAFTTTLAKYQERWQAKGHIGSPPAATPPQPPAAI
ncbi:MAG: nucleotide pyrophosphohydrolase [Chloroflexi bacterium]|nr:MAG: nucleotide pyrophosphohydrolase [Chloroflexota bacterium]PIE80471.1 MAG: nucleotide pyrophosphohydrolase [Chloroflexota bacterium]